MEYTCKKCKYYKDFSGFYCNCDTVVDFVDKNFVCDKWKGKQEDK